jgi:cell division protein FtsQ
VKRPEGFDGPPNAPRGEPQKRVQPAPPAPTAPAAGSARSQRPAAPPKRVAAQRPQPKQRVAPAAREAKRVAPKPDVSSRPPRAQRRHERAEARRFTRGSRRRRAAWLSVLGVVALMFAVLLIAIFSPILALRTIEVDGVSAIPASTVQRALSSQLGTPLALLDNDTIRSRLSRIILIRSYVTEVVPPNTLVVRIVEREAIGVIPDGSGYEQVDPAGVVLRKSATAAGLPIIEVGRSGVNSAGFSAAVKVLLAMPSSVLSEVRSITATTLDNVSLTLDQGSHTILWGSSAQSDLKAQALTTLLKTCASQQVLNVTAPLALACGPQQKVPTTTPTPRSKP